jgi:ribokinase
MITILGDLIADFSLRVDRFPIEARSLLRADYLELGPGGASNVAITAVRLGLGVKCLGEVGPDPFGEVVLEGLEAEGVDISGMVVSQGAETPVAGVVVDQGAEPAYVGYPGALQIGELLPEWDTAIRASEAFFVEGWVDHEEMIPVNLQALESARRAGVPAFFDPGPGNPALDREWRSEAAANCDVLMATEGEARDLTLLSDPVESAKELLARGPDLVVIKRGPAGCLLLRGDEVRIAPGFPVVAVDTTGAGDSLNAAVILGYLRGLDLEDLGTLANAVGAAKVQKRGTGRNVPTLDEVRGLMARFGKQPERLLP